MVHGTKRAEGGTSVGLKLGSPTPLRAPDLKRRIRSLDHDLLTVFCRFTASARSERARGTVVRRLRDRGAASVTMLTPPFTRWPQIERLAA
jgi:hypothetical protein